MLRVLTLNLNHYADKHGKWADRRERLLALIAHHQPDIMMFQAVAADPHHQDGTDQATQIGQGAGYDHVGYWPVQQANDGQLGAAIVSRTPWEASGVHRLQFEPNPEDQDQRQLVWVRIACAGLRLHLVNAHFSWVLGPQNRNARDTAAFLQTLDGPSLLMGDLNAMPDAPAIATLTSATGADIWRSLHPGAAGATFETDAPRLRIDYAFISRDWPLRPCAIETLGSPTDRLSDHLGLLVTFDEVETA